MNCTCCESKEIFYLGKREGFSIYRCKDCKFEFIHPLPSTSEIQEYYNKTQIQNDVQKIINESINSLEKKSKSFQKSWYEKVLKTSKKFTNKEKLKILEVGSGFGNFIHYTNTLGHNAVGTEVTKEIADCSRNLIKGEIKYIKNNRYQEYFENEKFDLIYLEHVFEHILNPYSLLGDLKSLLDNNGIIMIIVPNHRSFLARIFKLNWSYVSPPYHVYHYNKESLTKLLEKNEFTIVKSETSDYFRSIIRFYSINYFINRIKVRFNKYLHTNFVPTYSVKTYDSRIKNFVNLLPYWFFSPILIILYKLGLGNELLIIAKRKIEK